METQTLTPVAHSTAFINFIGKLANKFQPLQIFNFSYNNFVQNDHGCFKEECNSHYCNYCLLLITESCTRIDHDVQDYANTMYKHGTITVICHCKKVIDDAIAANNRFFITVLAKAELLYSHNGLMNTSTVTEFDATNAVAKLRKHYEHRFSLAEGFYLGANDCMHNWEQYGVATFMLHQAVEQLCIGLIRVQMAYRSEFHNLHRLLRLCTCFSHEPLQLFTATAQDRRLFDILCKSYSSARYQANFTVSMADAHAICDKVMEFTAIATRLCDEKIREMEFQDVFALKRGEEEVLEEKALL